MAESGGEPITPIIVDCNFSDIDAAAEVLSSRRTLQLIQLSTEKFHADVLFMECEEAQFIFSEATTPVRTLGAKPTGYLPFGFVLESGEQFLISHGHPVTQNTLFGLDLNRSIDMVVPARLKLCNVLIQKELFEECLEIMDRTDISQQFFKTQFLYSPNTLIEVRCYLRQLQHLLKQQPQVFRLPHLKKLLLEDFIPLLINAIPPLAQEQGNPPLPLNRVHLVREAEAYMLAHLHQPVTLKDLCNALHTSGRPLFYGFQQIFGLSPMAYLKRLRLHSARKALTAADPSTTTVQQIAYEFGFWNTTHFAGDYKALFRELPSETLKRSA